MNVLGYPNIYHSRKSQLLSFMIIFFWFGNLYISLTGSAESFLLILFHAWLQSFLFVGLFVSGHDCIHGLVFPGNEKFNDLLGSFIFFLFAGFKYRKMKDNHLLHHQNPAQDKDPDYSSESNERLFAWFFTFIKRYFGLREFLVLHLHVGLVFFVSGFEAWKVFAFFAIPSWVASFQLFYFGTYLPHRGFRGVKSKHSSRSNNYSTFLSLMTCFHFGYHVEHHEYPHLAWWRLPAAYKINLKV